MAKDQERATSRPPYVHSRRDFSSFLRAIGYQIQYNTIIFVGGQAKYEPNRSQELAEEMADGRGHLMTHLFDHPDATAVFLERASSPD